MRMSARPIAACGLGILLLALTPAPTGDLRGFTAESTKVQRDWEAKFRAIPSPDSLREYMRHVSARPHHVGSPYDKDNADWILAKFKSFGLDARIETFDVLFPTPKERVVELVAPTKFVAKLQEPPVPGDPTSSQQAEQLPSYNAYSIDGDVTAPLVYVNYGVPADYERLERMGVSVKGAIVIARYFGSWRGIKPKVAAEHGAVGCIIYSDPRDDGFTQGDVYPQGPWRPKDGVQRGSVMDMPLYPGDPLTPGVGATQDAKRLQVSEAPTITKIPLLPISYGDAQPLLAALRGVVAPQEWRGGLGITYHVGPGPAKVHLRVTSDWSLKTLYDVIARIPGAAAPDEWVIRGNHHDAWVNGAEDPISGLVPLLEEARAYGQLLKQGWKPRRTIIYAAWDGEEPALLGSTEWVEEHADELAAKAVAYLNSDTNNRGYLDVGGSHSLEAFINDVARDIEDPETKLSAWKRAQLRAIADASSADVRQEARQRADLRIDALGSGSDFTPFLQHVGIATLNLGYRGDAAHRRRSRALPVHRLRRDRGPLRERSGEAPAGETGHGARAQSPARRGRVRRDRGPPRAVGPARAGRPAAVSELRAARQRGRRAQSGGGALRTGFRESPGEWRGRPGQAGGAGAERHAAPERTGAHERHRSATATLVPPPDLRTRVLHRLRRQDAPRRARGDRAEKLVGSRAADRGHRASAGCAHGRGRPRGGASGKARALAPG